jgi:hypothetical protein
LDELSHKLEFRAIDETFNKLKREIRYSKVWATSENLTSAWGYLPAVLHFSGHGVKADPKSTSDKDYLIVENEFLEGQKFTETEVKKLFIKEKSKIQVAVILSCHSQSIGEMFKKVGIKHVIWIDKDRTIPDEVCITFTKSFYNILFGSDSITICEAFEHAKKTVENLGGPSRNFFEAQKFMLLTYNSHSPKKWVFHLNAEKGKAINETHQAFVKSSPDTAKQLVGREKDIISIIKILKKVSLF